MAAFTALATSYATWEKPMLPVYLFYSMFGFQRVGDLTWSLGDARGRGILAGCTAGRTTLLGEGLQHADGHSPLLASVNPACVVYDPAFAYELAVILEDAVKRILGPNPEDRFWYITLYNENYPMPALPGAEEHDAEQTGRRSEAGSSRAHTGTRPHWNRSRPSRTVVAEPAEPARSDRNGAGIWTTGDTAVLRQFVARRRRRSRHARSRLGRSTPTRGRSPLTPSSGARRCQPSAGTGFTRDNRHALRTSPVSLGDQGGPVIAVTDYMRAVPDQMSRFVERRFVSLGTDGFGRSDTREALRSYFEVDATHVVLAVLAALAERVMASPTRSLKRSRVTGSRPNARTPGHF